MKKPFSSKAKRSILSFLIAPVLLVLLFIAVVYGETSKETTLDQLIDESAKSIDIVNDSGDSVGSPSVSFDTFIFSFDPGDSSGVLGTATEKIRVSNPTITETWTVSIAATGGVTATWSDGGTNTYPYNDATAADNGRLTVNAATNGVVTPGGGGTCTTTSITKEPSATFVNGTTDSIDILSAAAGADTLCYWDLTAVDLTQRIPASQPTANYSLPMTLSII